MRWQEAIDMAMRFGFSHAVLLPARYVDEYSPDAQDYRTENPDPREVLSGAQSILIAAVPFAWYGPWPQGTAEVSAYYVHSQRAYRARHALAERLRAQGAAVDARHDLPLKLLGREAGLGVIGRNCLLRNDLWGSCFVMQMLITDIAPQPQVTPLPATSCGDCRRCVQACPTGALRGNGRLTIAKCIRAHMLMREPVNEALRAPMGVRYLGCEACQRACPRNAHIQPVPPDIAPAFAIATLLEGRREGLAPAAALIGTNETRPQRAQAQAALAAGNAGDPAHLPALRLLAEHEHPAIREHARWAMERIGQR